VVTSWRLFHVDAFATTPFAGNPAAVLLAAARVLFDLGLTVDGQQRFATAAGPLAAQVTGDWIQLRLPALQPVPLADQFLGGQVRDLLAAPVTELLRNNLDVIAVLGSPEDVRQAQPDLQVLQRLPVRGLVITASGDHGGADFVSRFFSPATGIAEDAGRAGRGQCAAHWPGHRAG
jgi:predicted PhzF superfamily epimerase YddE/YHI9